MTTTLVPMILAIIYPVVQTLKFIVMITMNVLRITVVLPLDVLIHILTAVMMMFVPLMIAILRPDVFILILIVMIRANVHMISAIQLKDAIMNLLFVMIILA
jgi:hypothetical protein